MSLEEVILRHALGMGLDGLTRESQASGVMMLPIRSAGVLDDVSGQERALAIEGVVGLDISIPSGRPVVPLPEGDRYLGFIFARGPTPHVSSKTALRQAEACLDVAPAVSEPDGRSRPDRVEVVRALLLSHLRTGPPATACWLRPPRRCSRLVTRFAASMSPSTRSTQTMSTGPTGWRSPCRCTPPCAWHCGWPERSGPGDPNFHCASMASMHR